MTTRRLQLATISTAVTDGVWLLTLLLVAAAGSAPARAEGQSPSPSRERTGAELYQAACAACHGRDGRGAPQSLVGLDIPLPDFTDCAFGTPEPDSDWMAVSHDGGPARAFDRRMPAFGGALSVEELQRAIDHVRTFCTSKAWPRGELNLPRALVTEKAFPENDSSSPPRCDEVGNDLLTVMGRAACSR
jgi:mono/diheme cytochrome c family protein